MANEEEKILVAMSGGVDSSVTAALLVEQGLDVTGVYMKNWSDTKDLTGVCEWKHERRDAQRVASKLGISLLTLDFEKEYRAKVVDYMFSEFKAGRTPNPDVLCNKFIKFGELLKFTKQNGFTKIATGHYAGVSFKKGKYHLMCAADPVKDQTYFLHQLKQSQLKHILFPLVDIPKSEVRPLARKYGLATAEKKESMGVCFVGPVPMREFLAKKIKPKPGKVLLSPSLSSQTHTLSSHTSTLSSQTSEARSGIQQDELDSRFRGNDVKKRKDEELEYENDEPIVLGQHDGLPFYTLGQRHGFAQRGGKGPLYVVAKDKRRNILIVGQENDPLLFKNEIEVKKVNWITGKPKFPLKCLVRYCHGGTLHKATVFGSIGVNGARVKFDEKQRALTPGQFVVFYDEKECLGGGVIS